RPPTSRVRADHSSGPGGWRVRFWRSSSPLPNGGRGSGGSRCEAMVNWTAPVALWLLAIVPAIWFAPLVARTTFHPRPRVLQAPAPSLLVVALVLAIARPVLSINAPRQSIVYLVDVSHSISSRAIEDAARRIDGINGTLQPSYWRIVIFGSTAATVPDTAALRRLAPIETSTTGQPVDRSGSDLESAPNFSRGQLAPDWKARMVPF